MQPISAIPQPYRACETIDLGTFYFYENYLLGQLNEGALLNIESSRDLVALTEKYFENRDYAYISFRSNSYSLDPAIYQHLNKLPNLKGIAIIHAKPFGFESWKIEKKFFQKPMEVFDSILEALQWIDSLIDK